MDRRYFRLITRAAHLQDVVRWDILGDYSPYETFRSIFRADNLQGESYFDRMTHFDFKPLLPALLQVEDRMSMAHGLEVRAPFLDHRLVELVARLPGRVKVPGPADKPLLATGGVGALIVGVPLIVVPLGRDQPDNAGRVVHAGAGIRLRKNATVSALRTAISRVIEDPRYRAAAQHMAARLAAERDDDRAVDELERLLADGSVE